MSAVSGVFSNDYYEDCWHRLKRDDLIPRWVLFCEANNEGLQTILATFVFRVSSHQHVDGNGFGLDFDWRTLQPESVQLVGVSIFPNAGWNSGILMRCRRFSSSTKLSGQNACGLFWLGRRRLN